MERSLQMTARRTAVRLAMTVALCGAGAGSTLAAAAGISGVVTTTDARPISGALLRYDPKSNQFETFKLPTLSPREYEVPYALNVHPATGDIWITSNMSDRIFRFTPATRRFVSYPMPTRVMWLRDMEFTKDGKVCSSSSNLPAYGIEDKVDAFICLDPEGGARDMAAVATAPARVR
jgi:streptogramin lyase